MCRKFECGEDILYNVYLHDTRISYTRAAPGIKFSVFLRSHERSRVGLKTPIYFGYKGSQFFLPRTFLVMHCHVKGILQPQNKYCLDERS